MEPQQPQPPRHVGMRRLVGEPDGRSAATALVKERLRALCSDEGANEPDGDRATKTALEDRMMMTPTPGVSGESHGSPHRRDRGSRTSR